MSLPEASPANNSSAVASQNALMATVGRFREVVGSVFKEVRHLPCTIQITSSVLQRGLLAEPSVHAWCMLLFFKAVCSHTTFCCKDL